MQDPKPAVDFFCSLKPESTLLTFSLPLRPLATLPHPTLPYPTSSPLIWLPTCPILDTEASSKSQCGSK